MTRAAVIEELLETILKHEGWPTYTNRRADRGGPTKGGITLETLSEFRGRPCTIAELQALSLPEARTIYRLRYIQPWEFVMDDALLRACVDYAVTSGHDDPIRALQTALGVPVDGRMGPVTRTAIVTSTNSAWLIQELVAYRIKHQVNLALNDPKLKALIKNRDDLQLLNLRGWVNRSLSFLPR